MTSPPSPPNRHRRRVVVVVTALALVSMVSWWHWPRGDARFVGKWQVKYARSDQMSTVSLRAHGRGLTEAGTGFRAVYPWRVEGDRLIIGQSFDGRFQGAINWLTSSLETVTGTAIMLEEEPMDILDVTPESVRVRDATFETMGELIFTRIPE